MLPSRDSEVANRALVAVLGMAGQRLGDLGLGLDVAPHHVERAADVVERAGDTAGVVGAAEQLEAALQVLERELEVALAAPHPAHLVERFRSGRLARGDPRQPQHALERAERCVEVADQLVDRREVAPKLDPRAKVVRADAGERLVVELDRALVGVARARGLGGAAEPQRGLAGVTGEHQVARDLLLRRRAQPLGVELDPARDDGMVGAAGRIGQPVVEDRPQVGAGEPQLALAGDRRLRHLDQPAVIDQPADRRDHRLPALVVRAGDLRQRRPVGIGAELAVALEREDRVEPRGVADAGRHLEHAALERIEHAQPGRDQGVVAARQRRHCQRLLIDLPLVLDAEDAAGLEQEAQQLEDRARRAVHRADVRGQDRRHVVERLAQLAQQFLGLGRRHRGELEPHRRNLALAEARVAGRELRRRGADDHDAMALEAGGEVLDEVDRVGAAQLEAFDHEQQWIAIALGGEEPLERHEQPGLEALVRAEQRRDDRAVLVRHAQQVRDQVSDLGEPLGVDDLGELGGDLVAADRRVPRRRRC